MKLEQRITLLAALTVLVALPGQRAQAVQGGPPPPLCDEICTQNCDDLDDEFINDACQALGCGAYGVCPGDGGSCDFDWGDDADEEVFCVGAN